MRVEKCTLYLEDEIKDSIKRFDELCKETSQIIQFCVDCNIDVSDIEKFGYKFDKETLKSMKKYSISRNEEIDKLIAILHMKLTLINSFYDELIEEIESCIKQGYRIPDEAWKLLSVKRS